MKRFLIFTCTLCLFSSDIAIAKLRAGARTRRDPWSNHHANNIENQKEEYKHTRYRTMRYGPDILFKRIRNREVEDQYDSGKKSKHERELQEYLDTLDDILTKDPFDKTLFTSTGYHVLTAPIFCRDLDAFKKLLESLDESQIFQPLDPMNNNILHLCAMLNLQDFVQCIIEYTKNNKSSFQVKKALSAQNCANNTPEDIAEAYDDKKILTLLKWLSSSQNKSRRSRKSTLRYAQNSATINVSKNKRRNDRYYDDDKKSNSTRSRKWGNKNYKEESNTDEDEASEDEKIDAFQKASYDYAFMCIMNGDFDPLMDKLKTTPSMLSKKLDLFGNNLFHILALFGEGDIIKEIISEQDKNNRRHVILSLNAGNKIKSTPVHISASMNDFFVTESLLTYNDIDLSIQNSSEVTPLMLLLRNYKEYQSEKEEAFEHIHALVIYRPESNYKNPMFVKDGYGNTAYHFACMQGSLKNIVELALYGGPIYAQDNNGRTGEDKLACVAEDRLKNKERFKAFTDIMDHIYNSYDAFSKSKDSEDGKRELQKALQTGRKLIKMNATDSNTVLKERQW